MNALIWRGIAKILSVKWVADRLIWYALDTPYTHITGPGGSLYMGRWWVFNPYPAASDGRMRRWGDWMPSVRVHHILRADSDQHKHDHPWDARTIILRNWYNEERKTGSQRVSFFHRKAGDTATLRFGEYHRISNVPVEGVWTLFITWKYQGTWGFEVDGKKVPWRQYLRERDQQ